MKVDYSLIKIPFMICISLVWIVSYGQNSLSFATNAIQPGDSVSKQVLEYVDAGDSGENVLWDFGGITTKSLYKITYDTISASVIFGYDTQKTYKYLIEQDKIYLLGYDSPLSVMDFKEPQMFLPLPLQYSQTATRSYYGEGRYCEKYFERTFGNIIVEADGLGTIILSEDDTLSNTLRVHTIDTSSIRLNTDSCRNDSDNLKQVITEHYQWFSRGYRYPVFETYISSTYNNLSHVATQQFSYRCLPSMQLEFNDSVNERIRKDDMLRNSMHIHHSESENTPNNSNKGGFKYELVRNGNHFTITYDLSDKSHIHAMVVDVLGSVYRNTQQTNEAGTGYTMNIDCSGLRRGQYIIYINVNGTIYNSKISVK